MVIDRLHVLVLDGGAQFSPPIMRALKRRGARVTLAVPLGGEAPAAGSRFCDAVVHHPPLEDGEGAVAFLHDVVSRLSVDVVLPTVDEGVIALRPHRAELERIVPLAMPPEECLASALDKATTVLRTGENGASFFRVPPTLVPETAEEAVASWTGRYPVILKPRTGTGSEGLRLARDADELRAAFALVSRRYPKLMVQEQICYRSGDKFVLLYLFDAGRRLRSWYAQRVLLERRSIPIGVGGGRERVRGGVALLWRSVEHDDLLERGRRLLEALGWCGLAAIECARDERDGQYYLFEINARLDGTSTLALRDGPNFAYDSCLVALDRELPVKLDFRPGVGARKGLFTMLDAREFRSMLALLDPRFAAPLPALLDPLPLIREALRLVRKRRRTARTS